MPTINRCCLTSFFVLALGLVAGCETEEQKRQKEASRQRELQMAEQAAAGRATAQAMRASQIESATARTEGYAAGEAAGRLAALKDIDQREARAREEGERIGEAAGIQKAMQDIESRLARARESGHEAGRLEGEAEGYDEGMATGEKVGYAKAEVEAYGRGKEDGAKYGEIKGRSDAKAEAEEEIVAAEARGEERGKKMGHTTGFEEGKEVQRRESYYRVAGVALSISALMAGMLFFTWTRLSGRTAKDEEGEKLRVMEQAEQDRVRFLGMLEQLLLQHSPNTIDSDQ